MSPPTEQVIKNYLSRLAVAARGRLSTEERRALAARTRDFIDRNASTAGPPTAMEVGALLARLGDPALLVDQEVARLAAARGEAPSPPASRVGRLSALRRRNAQASWHWPSAAGSRAMQARLFNGDKPAPRGTGAGPAGQRPPTRPPKDDRPPSGASGAGPGRQPPHVAAPADPAGRPPGTPRAGVTPEPGHLWPPNGDRSASHGAGTGPQPAAVPPIRIPAQRGSGRRPAVAAPDQPAAPVNGVGPDAAARPAWPSVVARGTVPAPAPTLADGTPGSGDIGSTGSSASFSQPAAAAGARALLAAAARLASRVLAWARRYPLEAAAATLLGPGGLIYPPLWLLGAGIAVASRLWDYRDKWLGLAGPVLLLVVGTALGVSLGSRQAGIGHYVHAAWVYGDVLSRLGALLGTSYLVWRTMHARRAPAVPPWNKPRKVA